jgi:glycosyltransferase involved in cell wall biosynthesis
MQVLVNVEQRFRRTADGLVWTHTQFPYPFWLRYLEVFESVRIVARALPVASVPGDWVRVDGPGVEFHALPHYHGLGQYLWQRAAVQQSICAAIVPNQAVILRVHSPIGLWIEKHLARQKRPFGVEVVADPWELFSPAATRHPLRPWLRRHFARVLRRQCKNACAASYVTQFALQERYPPDPQHSSAYYSDVELAGGDYRSEPRIYKPGQPAQIITVGSLDQMFKGVDVLIRSVAECRNSGAAVSLVVIGDGRHLPALKRLAFDVGLNQDGAVEFAGALSAGESVRKRLSSADMFVLASRTEGLPRAMIEAMAQRLPCIGTNVGGIPELLPHEDRVPPNKVAALASKIAEVVHDPTRMTAMADRNVAKALEYEASRLRERRNQFYQAVRDATAAFPSQQSRNQEPAKCTP